MTRSRRAWLWILAAELLVLAAAALISICVGSSAMALGDVAAALLGHGDPIQRAIVLDIRVPRMLLGLAVGGSLSLAGVLLQGMFRNPLVEPFTLGVSGGAALGLCACLALRLGETAGSVVYPIAGFIGAAMTAVLVYGLGTRRGVMNIRDVVLVGVMVSFVCSSLVMLFMALSRAEDLHGIVFWTMGSLEEPRRVLRIIALVTSLVALAASYRFAVRLNALALGEDDAAHLGIDVERTKRAMFLLAALLTGVSVSVAGIIGFVGLVVPHVARLIVGRDHRLLLLSAFVLGAAFLVACDTAARTLIAPLELPVGVVTGIVGGSLFIYLLHRTATGGGEA